MPTLEETIGLRVVDELQRRESRLLSWGMVDGWFTDEEIETIASAIAEKDAPEIEPDDVLNWLLEDQHLLFRLPDQSPNDPARYRTRVGEAVRLLARLRQIFPWQSWRQSRELVADFRFTTRPREFPKREVTVTETLETITQKAAPSSLQLQVARDLLGGATSTWRLADFQVEATTDILASVASKKKRGRSRATIICAGTGSGKTLAFYLPAFMHVAKTPTHQARTQCLTIYPRNELLRDQLKTAVADAAKIEHTLGRPISIGVLYGDVPRTQDYIERDWVHQLHANTGRHGRKCPYFDCPWCDRALVWFDDDRQNNRERLVCTNRDCGREIDGAALRLTRKSLTANPPDILFTSTEMLNRALADPLLWPVFGIGKHITAPDLVLLDEVHTYRGIHGAQVSFTLKRWQHRADTTPHFVGLSATLAEPEPFMAALVGIHDPFFVTAIEPRQIETDGCETIVALRGAPGSATLSTTIQASMLLRRVLARKPNDITGNRLFVFTDNLDVTNRLYDDLADAEGWKDPRRRIPGDSPLAALRSSKAPEQADRFKDGQWWQLAENIGHDLTRRPIIGRTSAQDQSVDPAAETIVATASLEVGFDDPRVGAVIQHQAPKDPANYVQRKGRAGRTRKMRPWTVVVLSDFGKDRLTYAAYEQLFNPIVPARHLPVHNRHVLRMQMAFSLMDWLAFQTQSRVWATLERRHSSSDNDRKRCRKLVRELLDNPEQRQHFEHDLRTALGFQTDDAVGPLLWEPPRSLMFSVLPTIYRRLEPKMKAADGGMEEPGQGPLPEFVPASLFKDLNLPEVTIRVDDHLTNSPADAMGIRQALKEFAPGNVSRRFGVGHRVSHWVRPPDTPTYAGRLSLDQICNSTDLEYLGDFSYHAREGVSVVPVYRPHALNVTTPDKAIDVKSSARPQWQTQVVTNDETGESATLPDNSPWVTGSFCKSVRFYTHLNNDPLEMRRFTTGAEFIIKTRSPHQESYQGLLSYEHNETAAGLGFCEDVDGMALTINLPTTLRDIVSSEPELTRSLRVERFRDRLLHASALDGIANSFEREALAEIYITYAATRAVLHGDTLAQARHRFTDQTARDLIADILAILRPAAHDPDPVNTQDPDPNPPPQNEAQQTLQTLMHDPVVSDTVARMATSLTEPLGPDDEPWLRDTVKSTVGGALLGACQALCPHIEANSLTLDLAGGPTAVDDSQEHTIYVTETTVGGSGFIEDIRETYHEDPRRFFQYFEAELEPNDFEDVDYFLQQILCWLDTSHPNHDAQIAAAVAAVRTAENFAGQTNAFAQLRQTLRTRGVATSHAVISALALRLLRPGSQTESDHLVAALVTRRRALEEQLGIELDNRWYATVALQEAELTQLYKDALKANANQTDADRHAVIIGLLWPRGAVVRAQNLKSYNAFTEDGYADRLLLHAIVPHDPTTVSVLQTHWRDDVEAALREHGRVALSAPLDQADQLRDATLALATTPIATDSVTIFPRVRRYFRRIGTAAILLDLPEALQ